jgi:hypothetical protein
MRKQSRRVERAPIKPLLEKFSLVFFDNIFQLYAVRFANSACLCETVPTVAESRVE